ncbi:hypothetical protein HDU97_002966 [Phlyctochytrium planicorne]|nr:hypothetical protein HDU97_002966 [Phlyctochytrium planicorne]
MKLSLPTLLAFITTILLTTANPLPPALPSFTSLESSITDLLKTTNTKGAITGIVVNGKLIYQKSYGVRNTQNDPVTPSTLFQIGSNTKQFTSTLISILADEGKLDFDTPVTAYAPTLSFKDDNATQHATLIDIMSHRTGLPHHDLITGFWNTTADIISHIKYLDASAPFRTKYQYNNNMFLLAGTIAGTVNFNKGWHRSVKEKILDKLGMRNTYTNVFEASKDKNMAQGFSETGKLIQSDLMDRTLDADSPAGSISMNLRDGVSRLLFSRHSGYITEISNNSTAVKWVSFLQTQGVTRHGKRLLSQSSFDRLWANHTFIRAESPTLTFPPVETNQNYGLGFISSHYRSTRMICHGGATFTSLSQICTFPSHNTSFIVFTNSNTPTFLGFAMNMMIDTFLFPTAPKLDWPAESAAVKTYITHRDQEYLSYLRSLQQTGSPSPSLPLHSYIGTYTNPGYGQMKLTLSQNLTMTTEFGLIVPLTHWVNDTFAFKVFDEVEPIPTLMSFVLEDGVVVRSEWDLEPDLGEPVVFEKVQEEKV